MEPAPRSISLTGTRELIEIISDVSSRFHIVSLNRQIEVCKGLVRENPLIDVAILGQFKAGKSSFINSLVGKTILPVGVTPVTTVITRLKFGEQEQVSVRFFDGTRTEIPISLLEDYISEARNPGNEKNVEVVDIEIPSLKDYAGLRIVDTPGLGSVFTYHRDTSTNWLPEVGAAIVAVSADRPLSAHDIALIEDLKGFTPHIILLLTKADLLTVAQQAEVLSFLQLTLKRELGRELPIFLYSTRVDTQTFKDKIEAGLLYKIAINRDLEFDRILNHKIQSLLKGCLSYLAIALKTSLSADQDRAILHARILNERVNYDLIREQTAIIAREHQRQTRPLLAHYLEQFRRPLTEGMRAQLLEAMPSWRGNLWKLTRTYEAWSTVQITEAMQQLSHNENQHFYGTLKKSHAALSHAVDTFRLLLSDNIEHVLGIRLAENEWKIEVVEPDLPDIKILYAFDIHWDLLWFLIPMVIFRGIFVRHFMNEIPRAVTINISRLAAQWEERINRAIDAMRKQALEHIKEELDTIDALLNQEQGRSDEIKDIITELDKHLSS